MRTRYIQLGFTVITRAANEKVHPEDAWTGMIRHSEGDWGDVDEDDRLSNESALNDGLRLLSVCSDRSGTVFWIITEADRSCTTLLLPSDY